MRRTIEVKPAAEPKPKAPSSRAVKAKPATVEKPRPPAGAPDCSALDYQTARDRYRAVVDALAAAGDEPKQQLARAKLVLESQALQARLSELKPERRLIFARRRKAGLDTPLHWAIKARLEPALVAELEADALARLDEKAARGGEQPAGADDKPDDASAP